MTTLPSADFRFQRFSVSDYSLLIADYRHPSSVLRFLLLAAPKPSEAGPAAP
jgi:hypothetical protein